MSMAATWTQLKSWKADGLERAESQLTRERRELLRLGDEYDKMAAPTRWYGDAATTARRRHGIITEGVEDLVAEVSAARRAIIQAADGMPDVVRKVESAADYATRNNLSISSDGTVSDEKEPPEDATTTWTEDRQRLVNVCADLVSTAMRAATELDEDLGITLSGIVKGTMDATGAASLGEAAAQGHDAGSWSVQPPPKGGTPQEVARWWQSLSPAERDRVVADDPQWIGNLDGVPFTARDQANRNLFDDHRRFLEGEKARIENEMKGLAGPGAQGELASLRAELKGITSKLGALDKVEEMAGKPGHKVLGLDFSRDRAQAIIAQGNLDEASHAAVFTPGLTSTVEGMGGYDEAMRRIRESAAKDLVSKMSPEELRQHGGWSGAQQYALTQVATVTWLDYQAPQWNTLTNLDNSVIGSGTAKEGGVDLANFFRGIGASRPDDVELTALGHSYGSTTTGYALQQEGTGVDRAGLFGSPGIGTSDVDDLQIDTDDVYYGEAKWDIVGDLGRFGTDPSALGIQHFETGAAEANDGSGTKLDGSSGHSEYLKANSTSEYNLGKLVSGETDEMVEGRNVGPTDPPSTWSWPDLPDLPDVPDLPDLPDLPDIPGLP